MRRRYITSIVAVVVLCHCLVAQGLYQLATTDDGEVVYLATAMRQSGTNQPLTSKLFVVDKTGLHPYGPMPSFGLFPDVSGDGKVLAIAIPGPPCQPNRTCPSYFTYITGAAGGAFWLSGLLRLSQNGRYALQGQPATPGDVNKVWDLQTGQVVKSAFASTSFEFGRPIANDGTVAITGIIDPAASTILHTVTRPYGYGFKRTIMTINLADSSDRTLVDGDGDSYQPMIGNDGASVLFLSTASFDRSKAQGPPQVFLIGIDGSGLRQLTHDPAGIETALLAGNGRVAIVLSRSGRLQRVDTATGETFELVGRAVMTSQYRSGDTVYCTAGSICRLKGVGFSEEPMFAQSPVLPFSLGDFALRLDGVPVPLLWVFPNEVAFQRPWESTREQILEIDSSATFAFEPSLPPMNARGFGDFWEMPPPYISSLERFPLTLTAHQDFDSLVTPDNPAHFGEIVHLYATGMGPVTPTVATGQPAPSNPLSQLIDPMTCHIGNNSLQSPLEILYQGLAPGFTGIFQISIRLPDFPDPATRPSGAEAHISCRNATDVQNPLARVPLVKW